MNDAAPVVVMPPLGRALTYIWHLLFDLADEMPGVWCLIGGQMVTLHGLKHGRTDARPSADGDVLVDIRADPTALHKISDFLIHRSLQPDPGPDGILHRFKGFIDSHDVHVDVLAPDHVGRRADLTTRPPGRTVQVPGGMQALNRSEYVLVKVEDRTGKIQRPSLLAAILAKAEALSLPGSPQRHLHDLAFLLVLMPDPVAARSALTAKERMRLRACPLLDTSHRTWRSLAEADASAGHAVLKLLTLQP
jgi:hypothetical protein